MTLMTRTLLACALLAALPARAADPPLSTPPDPAAGIAIGAVAVPPTSRSGREIYERFRAGLADKTCTTDGSPRWKAHFAAAPKRLAAGDDDLLPLFGYVVDALREASLPTEYALIPFVESGYKPGARSKAGPAGLWQMIGITARHHKVPMRPGYDGRLSPVDSTKAAVRYLKTLHGMFAGDWRLAVMAYNAGEYRVFGALKRGGQTARNARPESLPGLSDITHSYVRKLHALSCLMEQADDREAWLKAIDRPVPYLRAQSMPAGVSTLDALAARTGQSAAQLKRMNPVLGAGSVGIGVQVLAAAQAPTAASRPLAVAAIAGAPIDAAAAAVEPMAPLADASTPLDTASPQAATSVARTHTVTRGDNPWTIARRYKLRVADLLAFNQLDPTSRLKPGQLLRLDADTTR